MRTSGLSLVVSVALATVAQVPGPALAGPVEQFIQVALHPTDPDVMVLRYVNGGDGLLYSDDGGTSFKLVCRAAIDATVRGLGPIAVASDGRVVAGLFDGLLQDQGGGCGFAPVPSFESIWISDIASDPTDPELLYVATSKSKQNGGGADPNGIYLRDASGQFTQFGALEELLITRLRLTTTDAGPRIYESAIHGTVSGEVDGMPIDGLPNYVIRVSDDGGETFTEFPYGSNNGAAFRLVAVDPTNPDRIVTALDRTQDNDELFISTDRGETFTSYLTLSQIAAIELLPDGRVFIGEAASSTDPTASVGLWAAASLDESPAKLADYPTQCLAYQAATDTLFACQRWTFGKVDMSDGTFSELVSFKTVEEFVSCDGVDTAETCEAQLCNDYCGLGHFSSAAVCSVYDDAEFCGVCAALMEDDDPRSECAASSNAGSGGGGMGAGQDGGASAGSGAAAAGAMPPAAGASAGSAGQGGAAGQGNAGDGGGGDDDGGCSCTTVGGDATARTRSWPIGLLLGLFWFTRRRRARA